MALQRKHMQETIVRVYTLLTEGKEETEILDELGITAQDYTAVKIAMFDMKAEELRKMPTEHVFVDYMIQQKANISTLSKMISEFGQSNQFNALVGAVKARSDILDKIIKTGQETGLIAKAANKHEITAGIAVTEMSNTELKGEITGALADLNNLIDKFGEGSIMELDVDDKIHRGPKGKLPEASEKKEE